MFHATHHVRNTPRDRRRFFFVTGMTQAELDIKLKDVKILPPKCAGGHYKFKYSMDDGKDIVVNSVYKVDLHVLFCV